MKLTGEEASVRRWLGGSRAFDADARLGALEAFCACVGRTPDELVADCLRELDGGRRAINLKARRRYVEAIAQFEASGAGRNGGNVVRSFLIHNGILIQAPILR